MPDACVFCRIVRGEMPAQVVRDDGRTLAILDIHPVAPGHTLVMPRDHHEGWTDLPPDLAAELARAAQVVAAAAARAFGAQGSNLLVNNGRCAGQAIPHVHVHVIPRKGDDGVRFNWPAKPAAAEDLQKAAAALKGALPKS